MFPLAGLGLWWPRSVEADHAIDPRLRENGLASRDGASQPGFARNGRRHTPNRLDADRCPGPYAIEQLVSIADRRHAERRQEPAVEGPRRRKLTHSQHDMRH